MHTVFHFPYQIVIYSSVYINESKVVHKTEVNLFLTAHHSLKPMILEPKLISKACKAHSVFETGLYLLK